MDFEDLIFIPIALLLAGTVAGIFYNISFGYGHIYEKVAEAYTQTKCKDLEGDTRFLCDGVVIDVLKLRVKNND